MQTNTLRDIPRYVIGHNTTPMHQLAHCNPISPSTFNEEPLIDASLGFYMLPMDFLSKHIDEDHYIEVALTILLMYSCQLYKAMY